MNKNLKEMYDEAASAQDKITVSSSKVLKKQLSLCLLLVVGVFAVIMLAVAFRPKLEPPVIDTAPPIQTAPDNGYQSTIEQDLGAPMELTDWQTVPYSTFLEDENMIKAARSWAQDKTSNQLAGYPSIADGYTNDISKAEAEDGSLNLKYSYVVLEDIEFAIATKVNRLINPVFGEWSKYQDKNSNAKFSFDTSIFEGMFAPVWLESYTYYENYSRVPILADWNADSYGGLEFTNSKAPYFFGEVKSIELSKVNLADLSGTEFIVDCQIEYLAHTTNGRVRKAGTLHLNLSPNTEIIGSEYDRLIVTEAWLQMDGEDIPTPLIAPVNEELESEKMLNATN